MARRPRAPGRHSVAQRAKLGFGEARTGTVDHFCTQPLGAEARVRIRFRAPERVVHVEGRDAVAQRAENVPETGRIGSPRDETHHVAAGLDQAVPANVPLDASAQCRRIHSLDCRIDVLVATETAPAEELRGLTEEEAGRRLAARGKPAKPPTSRSYWTIVRGNLFTLPNIILGVLGIATLALGQTADALFLGVVVANVVIGSFQEIRAKRALDRLAALVRPEARVIRDGVQRTIPAEDVVIGDLVALQPGDQVVADGAVAAGESLRLDESMLTGESDPVAKAPGDDVLSGAFAVEGTGRFAVTAVGPDSYAERITGQARTFRHPTSPFQRGLGRLILTLVVISIPLVTALSIAEWLRGSSFDEGFSTVVAGAINLIPEGLILLASIVYVTGALKMSRHGALVQQLNAVESLASADVVCTDKTGTLTEPRLRVVSLLPAAASTDELRDAFGRYAAASTVRNSTLAGAGGGVPRSPYEHRRRRSRSRLGGSGARSGSATTASSSERPSSFRSDTAAERVRSEAAAGRRVVAIASTSIDLAELDPAKGPPADLRLLGLATLSEELRPNIRRRRSAYFQEQEIALKVLSGDAPATVAAIATDAGISGVGTPANGADLPQGEDELQTVLRNTAVVGRISPEGKKRVVEALRDDGRYVGMIGDGVNDVPALKASRVAIAQGSGAQMARTVSDLVLVRGRLRGRAADGRGGTPDPPQHAARLEALHDEMPVRRLHRARARPRADRVPVPAASPETRRVLSDRDSHLHPRTGAERRAMAD